MSKWNPRFVLFCKSVGQSPKQFLEENKVEYDEGTNGAHMGKFMVWIRTMLIQYRKETGGSIEFLDQLAFDRWLKSSET